MDYVRVALLFLLHGFKILIVLSATLVWPASGSLGDQLVATKECVKYCSVSNCEQKTDLEKFEAEQPVLEKLLLWSCEDDCKYNCMWQTVELFKKAGKTAPQFHGKWPFIRCLGIQEPASMFFSMMNGVANAVGLWIYLSKVSKSSPLFYPSLLFGMFAINAWFWSSVFHSRDFPFTEKMDYFSATALVFYSIYYCIHRMSFGLGQPDPDQGLRMRVSASLLLLGYYIYHIWYLSFNRFDYGYNMLVNVAAGVSNGIVWILYHIFTRSSFSHQWKATYATIYTCFLLSFELLDFVPIFWIFDGHALWHLGTIIFPFFWYPFMVEESTIVDDIKYKIA